MTNNIIEDCRQTLRGNLQEDSVPDSDLHMYLIARKNPSMTRLQVPQVPSQGKLDLDVVGEFVIQTSSVSL